MEARHYVKWTPEREDQLRSLFAGGKDDDEIGVAMGIRPVPVRHKRHDLGLVRRARPQTFSNNARWTDDVIARLTRLWGEGHRAALIAQELGDGFTKMAVIGKARRLKLAARNPHTAPRPKREAKPRREHGGIWRRIDSLLSDANKACTDLPPDSSPLAKTIEGLLHDMSQCRYPVTTTEGPQLFCAADVVEGMPYCARHCAVCYTRKARPYGSFQSIGDVALRVVEGLGQHDDNPKAA